MVQQLLDRLLHRSERSWNSLIASHTRCGKPHLALALYQQMLRDSSVRPTGHTFVSTLKACALSKDLEIGLEIHDRVAKMGLLQTDLFVGSSLVEMYIKCGSLMKAHYVFDELPLRNVVSWTTLIAGYVDYGYGEKALKCFDQMQLEGVLPDTVTYVTSLKACGTVWAIVKGRKIHAEIERRGLLEKEITLGNAVVDMYAKCGSLSMAQQVFDKLPVRDIVPWTALIAGYAEHGQGTQALECLYQMQCEGFFPDTISLICSLKACSSTNDLKSGSEIHSEIEKRGLLGQDLIVGNSLIDMYTKCGQPNVAQHVFERLPIRNVVSWNTIIEGYAEHGCGREALNLYKQMQLEGIPSDDLTFVSVLKACRSTGALEKVTEIHAELERQGFLKRSLPAANMLVDIYATMGSLPKAQQVFDNLPKQDIVSWNSLLEGYADNGYSEVALECFAHMQSDGTPPDAITFVCILKACSNIRALDTGQEVHVEIERQGLLEQNLVVGNALVDMYAKCGLLTRAREVLDKLPVKDIVSWNVLITGYAEHGPSEEALSCFEKMQVAGLVPDSVSYVCSLKACGDKGAVEKGEEIHIEIERHGLLGKDVFIGSSLVDMYAKCGSLSKAQEVFDLLPIKNAVPWNALMSGYAQLGKSENVFCIFDRMLGVGMKPNLISFVVVLSACSRAGLFSKSQLYFEAMSEDYGIVPTSEHHTCLVDVFCRAGELDKAVAISNKVFLHPEQEAWHSLLSACKQWGNLEHAEKAFEHAVQMDKTDSAAYVLMSQIYASPDLEECN